MGQLAAPALQAAPRRQQRRHAEHSSADAQNDDDEVPQRPFVVEEREVEAVQLEPPNTQLYPSHHDEPSRQESGRERRGQKEKRRGLLAGMLLNVCIHIPTYRCVYDDI